MSEYTGMEVNIPRATGLLVALTTAVFAAESIYPSLIDRFALVPSLVPQEPWLLVTHLLLHANAMHIFGNMFALFIFGSYLEGIIGEKRFLFLYFASGIIAGLGQGFSSSVPSIGASGAVFGVIGMLAIIRPRMIIYVYFAPMPMIVAAAGFMLWEYLLINSPDNIGHAAHFTGEAFGVLYGLYWRWKYMRTEENEGTDRPTEEDAEATLE